jgi:hypothetical protein
MTTQHTGACGEFFVAAELSRRGWAVGLTRAGMKNTDILAEHTETGKVVVIQVKTSTGDSFTLNVKNEEPSAADNHWFVFVSLGAVDDQPGYFLLPHDAVAEICYVEHKVWMTKLTKRGEPHNENPRRTIASAHLLESQRAWDRLLASPPSLKDELSPHFEQVFAEAADREIVWPGPTAF